MKNKESNARLQENKNTAYVLYIFELEFPLHKLPVGQPFLFRQRAVEPHH